MNEDSDTAKICNIPINATQWGDEIAPWPVSGVSDETAVHPKLAFFDVATSSSEGIAVAIVSSLRGPLERWTFSMTTSAVATGCSLVRYEIDNHHNYPKLDATLCSELCIVFANCILSACGALNI